MSIQQIHLNAKRCSGRGVRIQQLTPARLDAIMLASAKLLDPQTGTIIELRHASMREGINCMIVEYTEETNLKDLGTAKWKKADPDYLGDHYSEIFTGKDDRILSAIYREYHEVGDDEVKDIMGKALEVSD